MENESLKKPGRLIIGLLATVVLILPIGFLASKNSQLQGRNKSLSEETRILKAQLKSQERIERQKKIFFRAWTKLRRQNRSLDSEMAELKKTLDSMNEEKTYLEDILIRKTKEIESLGRQMETQLQNSASPNAPDASVENLDQRLQQKNEELRRLNEQNKILTVKLERLYKMANDKIAEINVAKIALDDTISKARKNLDELWSSVDLGSISTVKDEPSASATSEPSRAAKKEGKVLAVNEDHGFVVVDMGKIDGIKPNTVFKLFQDGQNIGTLSVLEIREMMTACNVGQMDAGRKIQINDSVQIGK